MDSHAAAPEQVVDLERYPVRDPDSADYRLLVEKGQAELAAVGAVELSGSPRRRPWPSSWLTPSPSPTRP